MGASKHSDSLRTSLRTSSTMLKDARDHIVVGVFKKRGTFECDDSLLEFMEDEMKPVRVIRCLDPMKAKGYGLGHEFLVVDLQTSEKCQLLITAEKQFVGMKDENYPAGGLTSVRRIHDPPKFAKKLEKDKDTVKYDVDLQGNGKILMKDLLDILGACNPRYSFWKHNCWKYVYDTSKKLLEKFAGLADTSDDCKRNILKALKEMPCPSLPADILLEAGIVFLGCCVLGALSYFGAVGAIGAYKFLGGLKMAPASATLVKGLGGSSLFKFSITSANASLKKRPWIRPVCCIFPVVPTMAYIVGGYGSMRAEHGRPRQRDENS